MCKVSDNTEIVTMILVNLATRMAENIVNN